MITPRPFIIKYTNFKHKNSRDNNHDLYKQILLHIFLINIIFILYIKKTPRDGIVPVK